MWRSQYVAVMLSNGKAKNDITTALNPMLGAKANAFTAWCVPPTSSAALNLSEDAC